jgi:hypothetical protein
MMFQQRQSEAKTQLLREDNEIETTGKARENQLMCNEERRRKEL